MPDMKCKKSFCKRDIAWMSVQADDARAKVIHCETLDDKQKAKMLMLINTEPDTTLPVFTGVPDSLLGHTLSIFLEGMTADPDLTARIAYLEQQRQLDDGLARKLYDNVFRYSESKISKSTNRKLKGRLKAAYGKTVQGKLPRCVSHMTLTVTVLWLGF
ncbi:hypothetical protein WJX77_010724 [Trebouxia sp. C0004]